MSNANDDLQSYADPLEARCKPEPIDKAVQRIEDAAVYIRQQGAQVYRSTNQTFRTTISPLNGVLIGAALGFVIGAWWQARR
ncbi:hypothetical protein EV667_3011 [Ancylobacter aquaticus]|uniref:DUF883 domain-containing protein n=1 Tax=Ancylobacter aquaticus TaxID=100 RepID=A0A4R1I4Q5_ANCAQ|nr:hypothetical protein [Ancylobacter aquaticus]TCK28993.1 hypothetical protein EV667_3011 [Ancylobacter aquaticus]